VSHVAEQTAFCEKADKTIGKLAGNVDTRVKRIRHACRVADSFKDLFADASSRGNTLITLIEVLGAAQRSAMPAADVYSSRFCAPENPAGIVLNVASPVTLEGRIKVAVLGQSSKRVCAVASTDGSGVGKTCALNEVGCDPDVARHFTGGVYYMYSRSRCETGRRREAGGEHCQGVWRNQARSRGLGLREIVTSSQKGIIMIRRAPVLVHLR
jgi:hypothetical protein